MARADTSDESAGYNGPERDAALETAADYEELRFDIMKATSECGALLRAWEKKGGNPDDIRDLYNLRKMSPEEQQAELRRQNRVFGWAGIVTVDDKGQADFLVGLDTKTVASGIGNAPLGSRLSLVRARTAGYNDGRAKGSGTLQDGLKVWADLLGWEADSEEALSYAEGYGEGLKLRPPPKPARFTPNTAEDVADAIDADDEGQQPAAPRRGRPPGSKNKPKSATQEMAERAAAMDNGGKGPRKGAGGMKALPAPEPAPEPPAGESGEEVRRGWSGSDFTDDSGSAELLN
jgi:hypothetical protein